MIPTGACLRPAGGVWQGVTAHPGTAASAILVKRPGGLQAIVFIDIDGTSFPLPLGALQRALYREDGGGEG